MRLKIVLDDVSNVTALDCVRHSLGEDELLLPFRQIREAQIGDEGDKAILKLLVPMTLQNAVNLLLKVLELLLCSLSHVLHILLPQVLFVAYIVSMLDKSDCADWQCITFFGMENMV